MLPLRQELLNIQSPDSLNLKNPPYSNQDAIKKTINLRMAAVRFFAKSFGFKLATDAEADAFQSHLNNELNKSTVCELSNAPKAEAGGGFYAQLMTVQSFREIKDPRPKLKGSSIPVLLMEGQCDNQALGWITEYKDLFRNHQLQIISNAGHAIAVEQPELYMNTVRDFLIRDRHTAEL